jgi:hypothetical protein
LKADAWAVTGLVIQACQNALDAGQGLCMASLEGFASPDP